MTVSKANLTQPAAGSSSWNVPLNANFGIVTNALGTITSISVTSADVSLSTSQAQSMGLNFSGVMIGNFSVLIPAATTGQWLVYNGTTGGYTLSAYVNNGSGGAAGIGVALPSGVATTIYSDGTNIGFISAKVADGSVNTAQLVDGSVTAAKLAIDSVTTAKILASNVTTAKIADANVTTMKIADANVTTAKIADASITPAKLNSAQSGSAPIYGVRAWGRIDISGALSYGGNVSSATRVSAGVFSISFTTAMSSANYAVVATVEATGITNTAQVAAKSSSGFTIYIGTDGGAFSSVSFNFIVIQ